MSFNLKQIDFWLEILYINKKKGQKLVWLKHLTESNLKPFSSQN